MAAAAGTAAVTAAAAAAAMVVATHTDDGLNRALAEVTLQQTLLPIPYYGGIVVLLSTVSCRRYGSMYTQSANVSSAVGV